MPDILDYLELILGEMKLSKSSQSLKIFNFAQSIISHVKYFERLQLFKSLNLLDLIGAEEYLLEVYEAVKTTWGHFLDNIKR